MSCYHSENLTICAPSPVGFGLRSIDKCPDCGKHTRMIYFDYEWYGREQTCLHCGRRWSGGEWMPLTFEPQSRRKSIEAAKRQYRRRRAERSDSKEGE